jgi:hypothetical protein
MAMGAPQAQLHPHNPEVQNLTSSCLIARAALVPCALVGLSFVKVTSKRGRCRYCLSNLCAPS